MHRDTPVADLPLFAARQARDEAIARVDAHANPEWKEEALRAIHTLAQRAASFTCDDVWETGLPKPHEGRALGSVMLRAARLGYIERTTEYVTSTQKGNHANRRVVWRSRLCRDAA